LLVGLSRSVAQQRFFLTLGAYVGEKQTLDAGCNLNRPFRHRSPASCLSPRDTTSAWVRHLVPASSTQKPAERRIHVEYRQSKEDRQVKKNRQIHRSPMNATRIFGGAAERQPVS
jgi:hypothetical protein